MEIYDIIHGNIIIDPLAKRIIDTEEFQRLRNIKQLGCCNYIFPSATHTRFEHSIGVYYLAKKFMKILSDKVEGCFSEKENRYISIAALIHDLGHGPYSHLFDEIFDESKNHEYRSLQIFKYMVQKYNFGFNDDDIKCIQTIIEPSKYSDRIPKDKKYIYQIVSNVNGIDVDRFDYITRDIKMTGLNYGIEYERIMLHATIIDGEILFSEKVKTNIDDFFRIRFIMHKEIYNHRTVRGIEFMMKEYIKTFDEVFNITDIIKDENWGIFIRLNDGMINLSFMRKNLINENKVEKSKILDQIMDDIHRRRIYKSVGEIITDSQINIDGYDKEKLIVDTVKITYYGSEKCKYIQQRNCINKSLTIENNSKYVTSVYYKSEIFKDDAEYLFEKLRTI